MCGYIPLANEFGKTSILHNHLLRVILMLLAILVAGCFLTIWMMHQAGSDLHQAILTQAELLAQTINIDRIKMLDGTPDDTALTEYQRVREQFSTFQSNHPEYRLVYLLGRKDEKQMEKVGERGWQDFLLCRKLAVRIPIVVYSGTALRSTSARSVSCF